MQLRGDGTGQEIKNIAASSVCSQYQDKLVYN